VAESAYDSIAGLCDRHGCASMPFIDVGHYRKLCLRKGGRVLELGCGTGRILLPLLDAQASTLKDWTAPACQGELSPLVHSKSA
jgi:hypothetical protein